MTTVKDLFENEELMNSIVEDIEDIPEDTEVFYSVWALGRNDNDGPTDDEVLVGEFTDPDEAVAYAEKVTLDTINEMGYGAADDNTAYFSIEVETVIADPDDEDGGTMNIGTVYQRDLWLDGSGEDAPDYDGDIVTTCAGDYELLDDGTLKLKAEFMNGFNKNDIIRVKFIDENDTCPLPYKIMSKVIYEDGDYFHCELMI